MSFFKKKLFSKERLLKIFISFFLLYIIFVCYNSKSLLLLVIPIILIIFCLISVKNISFFLIITSFCIPFSVVYEKFFLESSIISPTEPICVFLLLLYIVLFFLNFDSFSKYRMNNISKSILFYLLILLISSFFSVNSKVSFKYMAVNIWYIIPFYFFLFYYFKSGKNRINYFILSTLFSLSIIILFTLIKHNIHGFTKESAHWICHPFFRDHTSYGAMISFYLPFSFYYFKFSKGFKKKFFFLVFIVYVLGIIFSFTRASWISIIISGGISLLIIYRVKILFPLVFLSLCIVGYFSFQEEFSMFLKTNKVVSSSNLTEHFTSSYNISNDDSNLERINRWKSAWSMFKEKPVLGFGAGTYAFEYGAYQELGLKTKISTNFGDKGTAHSEYLGLLAECGILGLIAFLSIIISVYSIAIKTYYRLKEKKKKYFLLLTIFSFSTYVFHAFLNNFLDIDKVAIPFWGMIAVISFYNENLKKKLPENSSETSFLQKI